MSKIAIISQPDQGVLIDVSGCTTLREALEHLSSTLQVSNNFWQGMHVSINLGALSVNPDELEQILSIAEAVGIAPTGVYSTSDVTRSSLKKRHIPLGTGKPMTLPAVSIDPNKLTSTEFDEDAKKAGPLASITMRVVDAMSRRNKPDANAHPEHNLEEMKHDGFDARKADAHESPFPHVAPKKRKVSLDGRKTTGQSGGEQKKPVSFEPAAQSSPKAEKPAGVSKSTSAPHTPVVNFEVTADADLPNDKLFAQTLEIRVPPNVVDVSIVTEGANTDSSIAHASIESPAAVPNAQGEPISKELQAITGPQVQVKVMSFQLSDGMLEAQPAAQAIAQAATVTGEVVTHVDTDCSADSKVGQTILDNEIDDEDDDVEHAEEYDGELETESVDIHMSPVGGPTTLYLRQNLRSGQTVSHKGHLVIIGDINPGAEVMADGDITVWGCLRGVAHAGIGGNVNAEIRALKLQPIQIRIAHAIARAPDRPRVNYAASNGPETARMVDGKIKVVRSRLD